MDFLCNHSTIQASDILQECVLYIYGIAMFSFYYYYSKTHEKEVVTAEDLREMTMKFDEQISRLQNELETLRREKGQPRATNTNISVFLLKNKISNIPS